MRVIKNCILMLFLLFLKTLYVYCIKQQASIDPIYIPYQPIEKNSLEYKKALSIMLDFLKNLPLEAAEKYQRVIIEILEKPSSYNQKNDIAILPKEFSTFITLYINQIKDKNILKTQKKRIEAFKKVFLTLHNELGKTIQEKKAEARVYGYVREDALKKMREVKPIDFYFYNIVLQQIIDTPTESKVLEMKKFLPQELYVALNWEIKMCQKSSDCSSPIFTACDTLQEVFKRVRKQF